MIHQKASESAGKVSVILDLQLKVTQFILDTATSGLHLNFILNSCIKCLHLALTASQIELQLAGIQTVRIVAQTAIAENKQGSGYRLALLLMKELGPVVVSVVFELLKRPLTAKAAMSAGERLKLLVLFHSLVEGDEAQMEVLHILIPAMIAAASTEFETNLQIAAGLRSMAIKLVTHLASQANFEAPFRSVLSDMPPDLRQKLQDIIRASVPPQTSLTDMAPSSLAVTPQKLLVPSFSHSSTSSLQATQGSSRPVTPSFFMTKNEKADDDDDDDDDWDDFQSHSLDASIHQQGFPSSCEGEDRIESVVQAEEGPGKYHVHEQQHGLKDVSFEGAQDFLAENALNSCDDLKPSLGESSGSFTEADMELGIDRKENRDRNLEVSHEEAIQDLPEDEKLGPVAVDGVDPIQDDGEGNENMICEVSSPGTREMNLENSDSSNLN